MSNDHISRESIAAIHDEIITGLRDYMKKHGFSKAVIGLSGGIDSAVVSSLAAEAVGAENVLGLSMPSRYSSEESSKYAEALAKNLGIEYKVVPITDIYFSYIDTLKKDLLIEEDKEEVNVYLQNIQARIRGNILMAFSNKFGHLVLATGNKSELSVGYCTMYGDLAGGLAIISDIPKTVVYKLADYINRDSEIIPVGIINRMPSAELKPGQFDQDTLPPYDVLDKILYHLERECTEEQLLEKGFKPETIKWVLEAIDKSEYKRMQAPPGLKLKTKLPE